MRLDSDHAAARYEWARERAARGDTVAALDQLRRAVALQPSLVEAQRELARLSLSSRDWPTAAAALKAVVAWDGGDATVHADLATALEALGERADASRERDLAGRLRAKPPAGR